MQDIKSSVRSRHPEVFIGKGVLKICSNLIGERPWRSRFQSYFGTGVLLQICCIFSEHLFTEVFYSRLANILRRIFKYMINRCFCSIGAPSKILNKFWSEVASLYKQFPQFYCCKFLCLKRYVYVKVPKKVTFLRF